MNNAKYQRSIDVLIICNKTMKSICLVDPFLKIYPEQKKKKKGGKKKLQPCT